jgi:hypothetical protein
MPITSMSRDISRTIAGPSVRSRAMARATTIPAQPPSPWTNRSPVSHPAEAASAAPIEARVISASPPSSGPRRPNRSDSAP